MNNIELTALEKELISYDFTSLEKQVAEAKQRIATATKAEDVKSTLCDIWHKVRKFILALAVIPFIGKYVKLFADLMDSLCPSK